MPSERIVLIVGYSDDSRFRIGSEIDTRQGRFRVTSLTRANDDNWYVWGVPGREELMPSDEQREQERRIAAEQQRRIAEAQRQKLVAQQREKRDKQLKKK